MLLPVKEKAKEMPIVFARSTIRVIHCGVGPWINIPGTRLQSNSFCMCTCCRLKGHDAWNDGTQIFFTAGRFKARQKTKFRHQRVSYVMHSFEILKATLLATVSKNQSSLIRAFWSRCRSWLLDGHKKLCGTRSEIPEPGLEASHQVFDCNLFPSMCRPSVMKRGTYCAILGQKRDDLKATHIQ